MGGPGLGNGGEAEGRRDCAVGIARGVAAAIVEDEGQDALRVGLGAVPGLLDMRIQVGTFL